MSYKGRAVLKVRTLRDPGMHLNHSDSNSTRKVLSHLKYIGYRSREHDLEKDTKGLFNEKLDNCSMNTFYESVKNEKGLRHSTTVKIHKMIISFTREDYELYGKDLKEIARETMKQLEERKGIKLEWVGSVHMKETHPHVHLAIKSMGKEFQTDKNRRLYINKEDITFIKDTIDKITGREFYYNRKYELERDSNYRGMERAESLPLKDISKMMDRLIKEGDRMTEQAKNRADRQAQRQAERDREERER